MIYILLKENDLFFSKNSNAFEKLNFDTSQFLSMKIAAYELNEFKEYRFINLDKLPIKCKY